MAAMMSETGRGVATAIQRDNTAGSDVGQMRHDHDDVRTADACMRRMQSNRYAHQSRGTDGGAASEVLQLRRSAPLHRSRCGAFAYARFGRYGDDAGNAGNPRNAHTEQGLNFTGRETRDEDAAPTGAALTF